MASNHLPEGVNLHHGPCVSESVIKARLSLGKFFFLRTGKGSGRKLCIKAALNMLQSFNSKCKSVTVLVKIVLK